MLSLREQKLPGKKRYRGVVLVAEGLSLIVVMYESSEQMAVNDVLKATRLASVGDEGNKDCDYSGDSDNYQDKPAEKMVWVFDVIKDFGRRGTPVLQASRDLCKKYDINEPGNLVKDQTIIEHGRSSIYRIFQLTDQPVEMKETC